MKLNLVIKVQDFTKKLKINEEEYVRKYKELVGDDIKYSNQSIDSNSKINPNNSNNQNFLKVDVSNDILAKRDQDINSLVTSIHELATIFKDLQTLVLEQGTILDRIDYNIDNALQNTKAAKDNLVQADKNMKSNCARNVNLILLVIIFVFALLLVLKLF